MKFKEKFEKNIRETIRRYNLIQKNDKIIVACSGGKDSTTVLYLLEKFGYNVEALIIDLLIGNYSKKNLENIKKFCKDNKIKLHIINIRYEFGGSICYIRNIIQSKKKMSNCTICGVIKRWLINKKARELKADKIATGHNLDDEAENILLNFFKGNPELSINLGPKTGSINDKKFVTRIKPLYFCRNEEVKKYSKLMKFPILNESCPCSTEVFRRKIRKNLAELEKTNKNAKENIVKSFLGILPKLKNKYKKGKELKYCKLCREPSRNDICKTCELMKILKE